MVNEVNAVRCEPRETFPRTYLNGPPPECGLPDSKGCPSSDDPAWTRISWIARSNAVLREDSVTARRDDMSPNLCVKSSIPIYQIIMIILIKVTKKENPVKPPLFPHPCFPSGQSRCLNKYACVTANTPQGPPLFWRRPYPTWLSSGQNSNFCRIHSSPKERDESPNSNF